METFLFKLYLYILYGFYYDSREHSYRRNSVSKPYDVENINSYLFRLLKKPILKKYKHFVGYISTRYINKA